MASKQEKKDPEKRKELDERARKGEVVVPSGTGGKSLEAQEQLAAGRKKGGLSTKDKSGEERAKEEGIDLIPDDPKSKPKSKSKGR